MKKQFVLVCFLLCALGGQAQVHLGLKVGTNMSHLSFNDAAIKPDNLSGWQLGPVLEVMFPVIGIGAETGALYTSRGARFSGGDIPDVISSYLEVPLHLKWKVGVPIAKFYAVTGPSLDFAIGHSDIAGLDTKGFVIGWDFGAGVELFKHLQVGVNYGLGLSSEITSRIAAEANKNITSDAKSRVLTISATYLW